MLRKQLSRKWEGPQNFICPGATKRLVTPLLGWPLYTSSTVIKLNYIAPSHRTSPLHIPRRHAVLHGIRSGDGRRAVR